MAKSRGVEVAIGIGEHFPYLSGSFNYAVMMTVICFLDDMAEVLREAFRVLALSGIIVLEFTERDGEIFRHYRSEPDRVTSIERDTPGIFIIYAHQQSTDDNPIHHDHS